MPKTRAQKEETVQKLTDKISRSKSVVFANYQGLTMSQLSDIRNKLREVDSEFSITKNNLLKIALAGKLSDPKALEGPIATLFAYGDEITPIKILAKALKDYGIGDVKLGLFEGEEIDRAKVVKLSTLPSKEELRGKMVGVLVAPLHGIVGVLQANLRNIVYALDQIRIQKGGE